MQRYLKLILIMLSTLLFTACSWNSGVKFNVDLTREGWVQEVNTDPLVWARGTDPWFLSGNAYATQVPDGFVAETKAVKIDTPDFSNIVANGDFKVQIFGTTGQNTVYLYGSAPAVNATAVVVRNGTLYLQARPKVAPTLMRQVIIRIGVRNLNHLTQYGRGMIEGIRLSNACLDITSLGSGNIYLAGRMNVRHIDNLGRGSVNIFGTNISDLAIRTDNSGTTNVSGQNVGVRLIEHHGSSCINVINATTRSLAIIADGNGKIGVRGNVGLCLLKVSGKVRVYVLGVNTAELRALIHDRARIGLAGSARIFDVDANFETCVGAKELCVSEAFVRASDKAHVNVSATNKIFATASGTSSVYFFGSPDILTRFVSEDGFVMRMCTEGNHCQVVQEPVELVGQG